MTQAEKNELFKKALDAYDDLQKIIIELLHNHNDLTHEELFAVIRLDQAASDSNGIVPIFYRYLREDNSNDT